MSTDLVALRDASHVRVAVMSDTHIPRRARALPPGAWREVREGAATVHAGDVLVPALLDELAAHSPVVVVRGNNDAALPRLPERVELVLGGVPLAVVHDSGPARGRRERLRAWFPGARVVVFGHSHVPLLEDDGDLMLLNPGSPTDRRRMPTFTMARLDLAAGVPIATLVDLGRERA